MTSGCFLGFSGPRFLLRRKRRVEFKGRGATIYVSGYQLDDVYGKVSSSFVSLAMTGVCVFWLSHPPHPGTSQKHLGNKANKDDSKDSG